MPTKTGRTLYNLNNLNFLEYQSSWQSPSNIALVKYWGKHKNQIPANPSISFTLDACYTQTHVLAKEKTNGYEFDFDIYLDDELKVGFKPKIETFFNRIIEEAKFLKDFRIEIKTHNSFPHSSGIASSASGLSALSLCLLSLKEQIENTKIENFHQKASEWSRLGSGSASRSIYGGLVEWGKFEGLAESDDHFAIPYKGTVHPVFETFRDYVLLVEVGSKSVSSTVGHGLMKGHPFSERRFLQAHENLSSIMKAMEKGDLEQFGELVESEALTLHAMMMSSKPYFILMKPNSIQIIDLIWQFRKETKLPLYFTLDAGANVHLLFPADIEQKVEEFVKQRLTVYLKNGLYICDRVGLGPKKLII
tara:strand:+ start:3441 stop:4529 length:1089 start_codon:yes stop_codon:yes gene_type:complete